MPRPLACISFDLDGLWCYRAIHGLPEPADRPDIDAAYSVGVRRLLGVLDEAGIRGTLFAIGKDAALPAHAAMLRSAARQGHEVASHSYAHDYALRDQPIYDIRADIERAHLAIEAATGVAPVGFRTPGYNVDARILSVCAELGYVYDSSVFPCPPYWLAKAGVMAWLAARRRPSRSAMTRADTLLAPLTPYRPHATRFWQRDPDSRLPVEVPMCVVPGIRYPLIGTSLHLLKSRGFDLVAPLIERVHDRLLNLEFHAIDFMDDTDPGTEDLRGVQPDLSIPWSTKRDLYLTIFERLRRRYGFATLQAAVESLDMAASRQEPR